MSKSTEETIALNEKQAAYYDTKKRNWITSLWSKFRTYSLGKIRRDLGIQEQIYETHKIWMGDLSQKKVLDLGCYKGNALSLYLAKNSKSYLGIDLSKVGISHLEHSLKDIPTANAQAIDFLSPEFIHRDFDLVYAYGVVHHFENLNLLLDTLNKVLAPEGEIITYDPLKTSFPVKVVRALYRPFQSDAEWEWPFDKKTVYKLSDVFNVKERRAVLGRSKYVMFLNVLPVKYTSKLKLGKKWHKKDWDTSAINDSDLFKSMHLTMLLQKK